jgi:hypothetical protein
MDLLLEVVHAPAGARGSRALGAHFVEHAEAHGGDVLHEDAQQHDRLRRQHHLVQTPRRSATSRI